MSTLQLPRLYPIVDAAFFSSDAAGRAAMLGYVDELLAAGLSLLQYRDKSGDVRRMLDDACALRAHVGGRATLIMNDRADLALAAEFDGVHVGQEDLSPAAVRRVIGPGRCLGVSTHNPGQLRLADASDADYLAIGPVFGTTSKERPDPTVGLEGVRAARALTSRPLVAIGGITSENCAEVLAAGADSVAVISGLMPKPGISASRSIETFFRAFMYSL